MDTRSPSPSRSGKRRIVQAQDSVSEPPRKSPAARLFEGDTASRFRFDQDSLADAGSVTSGSPTTWQDAGGMSYSSAPFPSPAFTHVPARLPPSKSSPNLPEAAEDFPVDPFSAASYRSYRERRNSSKDMLDDYFSRRTSRRRSSCKEITLSFFPPGPRDDADPAHALYQTVETRRRLSVGHALREERAEDIEAEDCSVSDSEAEGATQAKKLSLPSSNSATFIRSLSAEGYDPDDLRERKQETQALLFDSTPDLTIEENYVRFPSIRSSRRGAVCYDIQTPLLCLQNLQLDK